MSKDYKSTGKKQSAGNGGGSTIAAGLLIGLFIGVAATGGVVWYMDKHGGLFNKGQPVPAGQEQTKSSAKDVAPPVETLTPQGATGSLPVPKQDTPPAEGKAAESTAKPPDAAGSQKDRFGFYEMLADNGEHKSTQEPRAADQVPAKVQLPKGTYLQVGAFQNESEANNLKARLALLGVEANLETTSGTQGVLHRVRVGPMTSQADIDGTRALLKSNGIESALVKN
ncbi:SPOR domain-containing protein [Burkholderiaceae bacterium DAT-1]|nr:SPOR domain-containing protein [Burkholderiaceae bacterium DAT-1]